MSVFSGIPAILLILLAAALAVAAGLVALSVLLSFSIAWYDRVQADPAAAGRRRYGFTARLLAAEFACLMLTLLLRPCGWLPAGGTAKPSRRPPVILLHGLFQNRSCLLPLQWHLRAAGFDRVVSINTPAWQDLDQLVATVAATVTAVKEHSGHQRVCLVGHSMGGILARCYLQLREGARHVAVCVTLGSPHCGSKLAPFAISRLGRGLQPESALLDRLKNAPLPASVHFTAIYSRHDNMVIPPNSARLAGAANVELTGIGHTALLFSPRAAAAVVAALNNGRGEERKEN
jgi:triacylglycerol esterase/lipase EstA (alpha/beta hydrolase family)